jgi:hypothetical protein
MEVAYLSETSAHEHTKCYIIEHHSSGPLSSHCLCEPIHPAAYSRCVFVTEAVAERHCVHRVTEIHSGRR